MAYLYKKKSLDIPFTPNKKACLSNEATDIPNIYIPKQDLLSCTDLTRLPYLHDETVLDCILARYKENSIYTWAGPVLVAVNPCHLIQTLYSKDVIKNIHLNTKGGNDGQVPHVYTIAALAHNRLTSQLGAINQAILVSGESGAGKTESARYLLKYLTQVESESYMEGGSMENLSKIGEPRAIRNRILASNPILEAFGNAATLRNHNSSRFGKLINLQYAGSQLKGASLDTYLLEKTRVTHQPTGERNFHIFYQIQSACQNGLLKNLEQDSDIEFRVNPSKMDNKKQIDDLQDFKCTLEAFNHMGFTEESQDRVFQVLSGIMHLGNVTFQFDEEKEQFVVSTNEVCQKSLDATSSLLGLGRAKLIEAFTLRKISVTAAKSITVYTKPCERLEECEGNRDSLMQLLYMSVFSYLVATINKQTSADAKLWTHYMAILDVYGFETFNQNSLEQLCINYANERLQNEFTKRYLASEQRVLIEEGFIELPQMITDNSKCVSALDSSVSVFAILNEECQLRRALNEGGACERVCHALQDTGIVLPPSSPSNKSGFVIRHYAGPVNYSSTGLLHKNKDEIPKEVITLLAESSNVFVKELTFGHHQAEEERIETPRKRSARKETTLLKFKSSLDSLMKTLTTCDLHYIRCVKPNMNGLAAAPEGTFLMNQLRANGILETVKISQAGYPVRMLYADFVRRYCVKHPKFSDQETSYLSTLVVLGDDGDGHPKVEKCRFGRKRLFLSESSLHKFEECRTRKRHMAAVCLQKYCKGRIVRLAYRKLVASTKILQHYIRCRIVRIRFLRSRNACVILQKHFRGCLVRKAIRRQHAAASVIQKYIRQWLVRPICSEPEASNCPSSLSMTSAYGSYSGATDQSNSEAGEIPPTFRPTDAYPEESGIETDTESLSGVDMKTGRACRIRSRKYLASLSRPVPEQSDDSSPTSSYRRRPARKMTPDAISDSLHRKFGKPDVKPAPAVSSKPFRDLSALIKKSTAIAGLQVQLPCGPRSLHYKDGVLTFRQIPQIKIRFHIRKTCLPYSTRAPYQERPQGLLDAII